MRLRTDGLTWNVVGDDLIVLDLQGSVYLKVNGSGRLLWEGLAEGVGDEELVAALRQRYGIDIRQAEADVAAFLADLRARDLLAE